MTYPEKGAVEMGFTNPVAEKLKGVERDPEVTRLLTVRC
jgi:hypothetical protein